MSFDNVKLDNDSTCMQIFKKKDLYISGNMQTTWEFWQNALVIIEKSQSKEANKYWKNILYAFNDWIWLSIKIITSNQLSKKLDYIILGSFKVIKNKKVFLKLQLSQFMKRNIFSISTYCKML